MLVHFFTNRNALHHSPTRERQEIYFATQRDDKKRLPDEQAAATPETGGRQPDDTKQLDDARADTRDTVRDAIGSDIIKPDAPRRIDIHGEGPGTETIHTEQRASRGRLEQVLADSDENDPFSTVRRTRARIEGIRDEQRKTFEKVLGDLAREDLTRHAAAENPRFSLSRFIAERKRAFETLPDAAMLRFDLPLEEAQFGILWREVEIDIGRLAGFAKHLASIKLNEEGNVEDGEGYYSRSENEIVLDKRLKLKPAERQTVLEHEQGHAVLEGIQTHLQPSLLRGFEETDHQHWVVHTNITSLSHREPYSKTPGMMDDAIADRYVASRLQATSAGSFVEEQQEREVFDVLEKRMAWNDDVLLTALEAAVDTGSTDLLSDPRAFARDLFALSSDATVRESYAWCNGDRGLLLQKLLKRFQHWQSPSYRQRFQDEFGSATEQRLFTQLQDAAPKHLRGSVLRELSALREQAQDSKLFHRLLLRLSLGDERSVRYMNYGKDRTALMAELLNRNADYRAGRSAQSFDNPDELSLFYLLDKAIPLPAGVSEQDLLAHIAKRKAESDGIGEGTGPWDTSTADRLQSRGGKAPEGDEKKQTNELDGRQVARSIDELTKAMHKGSHDLADIKQLAEKHADDKTKATIVTQASMNSEEVAKALRVTDDWQKAAVLIDDWEQGKLSPKDFLALSKNAFTGKDDYEALAEAIKDVCPPEKWEAATLDERKAMAKEIGGQDILKSLKAEVTRWQDELEKIGEYAEEIRRQVEAAAKTKGAGFRIEFYSINHFIESIKNVYGSYKKAWEQWTQLKVSKLSEKLGKTVAWLPGSDRAKITLEMDLDHKNDDTKDEFKKHLEHDLADFDHCADHHHGFLEATRTDSNRFRGTVEYMASKAWLYDLDIKNGTVFGIPMEIGVNLPANWTAKRREEYLRDLEQQQSKGEDNEKDRGKSRVNNFPDISLMIPVLEDELERRNYWATFGILERIVEKGKLGESPIWASVVILDRIRTDPIARKFFPKKLLDKYGNNGLPNGMIHKYFKLDRHGLERFQKSDGKLPFEQAGTFPSIFMAVKHEIEARQKNAGLPALADKEIHSLIAKVLAGQLVEGRGGLWKCHLYENNDAFRSYRKELNTFDNSIDPGNIDDDYYNPKNDISELHLGSYNYYQQILVVASQGSFVNEEKAKFFLGALIENFAKLKKVSDKDPSMRPVLANYVKATRYKLNNTVNSWTLANANQVLSYKSSTIDDRPLVLELIRCRLLDEPTDKEALPVKKELRQQMDAAKKDPSTGPFLYDTGKDLEGTPDDR